MGQKIFGLPSRRVLGELGVQQVVLEKDDSYQKINIFIVLVVHFVLFILVDTN